MRNILVKQLLDIAKKPHPGPLSVKRVPFRSSLPVSSLHEAQDALLFVFKLNWREVHITHCVESLCAIFSVESSSPEPVSSLCDCVINSAAAPTSWYEKVIPLAAKRKLFQKSAAMLQQVLSKGNPLSATLENCLLGISGDKPEPLLVNIQQLQSFGYKPGRPLFRRALKLCLQHHDQDKMAPIIAKLINSMRECYSKEEVESDVYCCALDVARHEEQFESIWHDTVKSGISMSSLSLVQSYLKGSVKLYNTDADKILKHLAVVLKAHVPNGVNLAVETVADNHSVERDMYDIPTVNIFQSVLLVHGIALSVKSYQYLAEQILKIAFNPIRRFWATSLCYHLLGGLLHTYDHMPPVLLLVETSKPLIITNGIEGFLHMFKLTDGSKQFSNDSHRTKATLNYLLKLAWDTDIHLGVKLMEEMLSLGLTPNTNSILKSLQQKKPGDLKGIEFEVLKCMLQLNEYPQQKHLLANTFSSLLHRIMQPSMRLSVVPRQVLSMASSKLLQTAQPTHEHCIQQLHSLL